MRAATMVAITVLTFSLLNAPGHAQTGSQSSTQCVLFRGACDVTSLGSIRMVDPQTGWAMTHAFGELLLRTTNGGTSWSDVTPVLPSGARVRVWRIAMLSSLIAWIMPSPPYGSTTTEVLRTFDGGRTWGSAAIKAPLVESISFINPREGWLTAFLGAATGRQDVKVYRSTDGGETWVEVAETGPASGLPLYGAKDNITFLNATTGWIAVSGILGGSLHVTRDGGRTWRQQDLPLPPPPQRQQSQSLPPEVKPRVSAGIWPPKFFTDRDGIMGVHYAHYLFNESTGDEQGTGVVLVYYLTHDGGLTWAHTTPVPIRQVDSRRASAFADMNHGWVVEDDMLYVTSDGGHRWATMRPGALFADVRQLDFISPQLGWAVIKISPYLLKTQDGGRTWTPVTYTISR